MLPLPAWPLLESGSGIAPLPTQAVLWDDSIELIWDDSIEMDFDS